MRHRRRGRTLGRSPSHQRALLKNLASSLLLTERDAEFDDNEPKVKGRIVTTLSKAKEVRRVAERMITLGKRGTLHARRQALSVIRSKPVAAKVFDELADRYREREGGYTRVLKLGQRVGDAAPISLVELVDAPAKSQD